jgi:hypothetical protein
MQGNTPVVGSTAKSNKEIGNSIHADAVSFIKVTADDIGRPLSSS